MTSFTDTRVQVVRQISLVVVLLAIATACGGAGSQDAQNPAPGSPAAGNGAEPSTAGELADESNRNDQLDEQELVEAAQAEGAVVVEMGGLAEDAAQLIASSFEEEYGIPMQFSRRRSTEIAQAVEAELAAGNLSSDVVTFSDLAILRAWADDGVIVDAQVPSDQLDVLNPQYLTPGAPYVPIVTRALGIMYNSARLAEDEVPASWSDLLEGDYRILVVDPASSGISLAWFHAIGEIMGEDYLPALAQRDVITTDSSTATTNLVLTGEVDLAVPGSESFVLPALAAGEPLAIVYPREGVPFTLTGAAMLADAPHPNAARLVMRYLISEELQRRLAEEVAYRPVLTTVESPPGASELPSEQVLLVDDEAVQANSDAITQEFAELFKH